MYERPTKGDLDRQLSNIMHHARRKAEKERSRLSTEFAAKGRGRSAALVGAVVSSLNDIHKEAVQQAMHIVHDIAERMDVPIKQITPWARPHLENIGNAVLAELLRAASPDQRRIHAQYTLVFQQRLDGALRDIEVGFIGGSRISPTTSKNAEQPKEAFFFRPSFMGTGFDGIEVLKRLWRWWKRLR
jgi:hypothetical protein